MLIDTHAHLNFKAFRKNLDNILWGAREKGITHIIVPGTDLISSKRAIFLAKSYQNIFVAVGVHPHHVCQMAMDTQLLKNQLVLLTKNHKVVAIGECGLDYYQYTKTKYKPYCLDQNFKKNQREVFIAQLEVAEETNLPLILHNREADKDIKKILEKFMAKKNKLIGVFHCFSGDKQLLAWVIKSGFYVGFDGNLTYDKELQELAKITPLSRIILETDSPFLTPEPLKSQKIFPNKPENVTIVARYLAGIKKLTLEEVGRQTSKNAKKLFKLL